MAFLSCSKKDIDKEENDVDDNISNFNITDYIIVGETFWGNDVKNTPPYIMEFKSNGKVFIYTLNDKGESTYSVKGNRITLDDIGYIDIENGQISEWLLVGNLQQGKLTKLKALENKNYPQGDVMRWNLNGPPAGYSNTIKNFSITISDNKIIAKYNRNTFYNNLWVNETREWPYTKLSGCGGVSYGNTNLLFYVNPENGKIVFWSNFPNEYCFYKY